MKTKKSVLAIALVVLVGTFAYYRYAKEVFQPVKQEELVVSADMVGVTKRSGNESVAGLREVSAEISYDTPGDYPDHLRFVVTVDGAGAIQTIKTLDVETGEIPEKKKEFNDQINVILKGKKLAELTTIDKVGKSSLTTTAFNDALGKLQAGL